VEKKNNYWINGHEGVELADSAAFPRSISGYAISFSELDHSERQYIIDLGLEARLIIKTWRSYARIRIESGNSKDFENSVGLMGSYPDGAKVARDGVTFMEDPNKFGQEWQVLPSEAGLFHNREGPQAPSKCEIPSHSEMRRRLGESHIRKEDAEIACSRVSKEDFDLCVFDVMATNNKDVSGSY